jgi:hypothetical protein
MFEKVFDNLVMFSAPESTYRVQFRPLPQLAGIQPEPPVPPMNDPGMVFFPTLGQELGYNIPKLFMDYITMHGTLEISGNPITELHALGNGISRQCFTNICLEYHSKAPETLRVRPTALGSGTQNRITFTDATLLLSQPQEIHLLETCCYFTSFELAGMERYPLYHRNVSESGVVWCYP